MRSLKALLEILQPHFAPLSVSIMAASFYE
jgi:hypothetical protein